MKCYSKFKGIIILKRTITLVILFLFILFNLTFAQNYSLEINKENFYSGDVMMVKLVLNNGLKITNSYFKNNQINFVNLKNGEFVSFIGIDPKEEGGKYKLTIEFNNGKKIEKIIRIKKRIFPITQLKTTPSLEKKGFTIPNIINNLKNENEIIENKVNKFTTQLYFNEEFIYPLDKIIIVGDYGNIRKSGKNEVQHLGVDLDGKIGDLIYAVNNGKVVLAKDLINYGKTIIIDHGGGIYSLYLHLNKFFVNENEIVNKGQKIGEVGNTGYSLGPHLHFSIKVNNISIDPLKFISEINKFINKNNEKSVKSEIKENSKIKIKNLTANINWGFKYDHRRFIDTIIIHSSYNSLDKDHYNVNKIINIYKNYEVLAHYLIDRQGNIYKLLSEDKIAYHAGKSKLPDNRTNVNLYSIGIELIYHKNESPNELQYQALNELINDIKSRYQIKYILGHKDIATDRKDDPWNFDWSKIFK
ncbi:MAG: hypothetical protein KatS3mg094_076 [Candidatus Parcubacteria bacterium]|nr:MAG: hypothetical protein KatS3mg094_076 [Candidatus Parcubacteria bacterium]